MITVKESLLMPFIQGWITNPWSPDARSNSADETRQVFQIEIASKDDPNSQGCSTQVAPEENTITGPVY